MIIGALKWWGEGLVKTAATFLVPGLGYLYLDKHVGGGRRVEGPSMSPTLNRYEYNEDKLREEEQLPFFAKRSFTLDPDYVLFTRNFVLERGDVVILEDPKSKNCYLVKRLVALPGDQIIPLGFNKERGEAVKLKEGEVWVESEAFGYKDSNMFGPVKEDSIQGKVKWATKGYPHTWLTQTRRIHTELKQETLGRLTMAG